MLSIPGHFLEGLACRLVSLVDPVARWFVADGNDVPTAPSPRGAMDDRLFLVFLAAFCVTLAMTPLMRLLAVRTGVIDRPDHQRKMHVEPIAYLGGVAIFCGWLAAIMISALIIRGQDAELLPNLLPWNIILGALVIVVVGVIDDVQGISPRFKIAGQLFAAAALANQSVVIRIEGQEQTIFLGAKLVLDSLSVIESWGVAGLTQIPFTLAYMLGTAAIALFVLGGCNAVNLIDGLDGLATGVVAIAVLGLLIISITLVVTLDAGAPGSNAGVIRIILCLALLGALLGFLPYNFNPASIFMGDAGSLLIGFLSIAIILQFAQHHINGPVYVLAGLVVMGLPITDTVLAIVRRKMRGLAISSPDRNHIHHIVLRAFLSFGFRNPSAVKSTVVSLYLASMAFVAVGIGLVFLRGRWIFTIFLVIVGFVLVFAVKSGYRQMMLDRTSRQARQAGAPASPREDTPVVEDSNPDDESIPITKRPPRSKANPVATEATEKPAKETGTPPES
ncbi:MAG: undecaprenyl/decaprenyl-phosphate alpha-N-acetylglucosaminyl 1-phosphate transferase [Phycisphaeraceae bacterium]|nr:undecaprenyl/decaprenyl-phosphate alpha-N-acetylglucosaminyl 1-phosphate transferase [Phycisphaeraceae bacterium]